MPIEDQGIADTLTRIRALRRTGKRKEPQRLLVELVHQMAHEQILHWRAKVQDVTTMFNDKPGRQIARALDENSMDKPSSATTEMPRQKGSAKRLLLQRASATISQTR